jgi:hypothetical protein
LAVKSLSGAKKIECVPLTQPLKFDTASDIGKIFS